MAKSFVSRIELSLASEKTLKRLSQHHGMTQVAVLSRVVNWFVNEPATLQAAVLGCYPPEIAADVAQMLMARKSAGNGPQGSSSPGR